MRVILFLVSWIVFSCFMEAQIQSIQVEGSFRGLDCSESSCILSGRFGVVGKFDSKQAKWQFHTIEVAKQVDLRSAVVTENWNCVASSGSPAIIWASHTSWNIDKWISVYTDAHPNAFLDGMQAFSDGTIVAIGDPVEGKAYILISTHSDSILSFNRIEGPEIVGEESAFAAGNQCLTLVGDSTIVIGTGGSVSRIWISSNRGRTWHTQNSGLQVGSGKGVFGIECVSKNCIAVGGSYADSSKTDSTAKLFTFEKGFSLNSRSIELPYCSDIVFLSKHSAIATGTSGVYRIAISKRDIQVEKLLLAAAHTVEQTAKYVVFAGRNTLYWVPKTEFFKSF